MSEWGEWKIGNVYLVKSDFLYSFTNIDGTFVIVEKESVLTLVDIANFNPADDSLSFHNEYIFLLGTKKICLTLSKETKRRRDTFVKINKEKQV